MMVSGRSLGPDLNGIFQDLCPIPVLRMRIRDPKSAAFLTSGSGIRKKSRFGSGMNIPDHIFESLETMFWGLKILKFFDVDANPGSGIFLTLDPIRALI
jgi:hypothetical protein